MAITATLLNTWAAGATGGTSGSINTSGYDGIALLVCSYTGGAYTISDNKGAFTGSKFGTGSRGTANSGSWSSAYAEFSWDKANFGSGHTFTISGTVVYPVCFVIGLIGTLSASNPKDSSTSNDTGTTASPSSIANGPITPTNANCILLSIVSSGASNGSTNITVSSGGFTKLGGHGYNTSGFGELGCAVAYLVQSGAGTSATCTWAIADSSTVGAAASMLVLQPPPTGNMFYQNNLSGVGAGGPFFQDPLSAKGLSAKDFVRKNNLYIPIGAEGAGLAI